MNEPREAREPPKLYHVWFSGRDAHVTVYSHAPPPEFWRGGWEVFADRRMIKPAWVNLDNVDRVEQP